MTDIFSEAPASFMPEYQRRTRKEKEKTISINQRKLWKARNFYPSLVPVISTIYCHKDGNLSFGKMFHVVFAAF
jgi:hypothetical protein